MNLIIRKALPEDVEGLAKVHVESWRSTYRGLVSEEYLSKLKYEDREKLWRSAFESETRYIWVAEVNGQVVGFVSGGKERTGKYGYDGELYAIYLYEHYQRKGIGKSLVKYFVEELSQAGFSSMLVWVLAENSSTEFYKSFRSIEVDRDQIEIDQMSFEEIAYGWKDINSLNSE